MHEHTITIHESTDEPDNSSQRAGEFARITLADPLGNKLATVEISVDDEFREAIHVDVTSHQGMDVSQAVAWRPAREKVPL